MAKCKHVVKPRAQSEDQDSTEHIIEWIDGFLCLGEKHCKLGALPESDVCSPEGEDDF